mgnify:FL=1
MLQGLSLEARQEALKVFRPLRLRRGAVLFAPGDPVDGVYLVRQGLVGLHRPGPGLEEGVLDVVGPGGVFGEEALGGEARRRAGAEALTYAELYFAPREGLAALRARFAEVEAFFLQALYGRLCSLEERLWEARHLSVAQRLARLLLRMGEDGVAPFSHQDLARMVGEIGRASCRERVFRAV